MFFTVSPCFVIRGAIPNVERVGITAPAAYAALKAPLPSIVIANVYLAPVVEFIPAIFYQFHNFPFLPGLAAGLGC